MKTNLILAQAAPAAPSQAAPAAPAAPSNTTQSTEVATDPTNNAQAGDPLSMLWTFLLIGVVFYFLMIRPQRKQQKEAKARQEAMKTGDKVITNAGIHGIIREVQESTIKLEIAANVIVKIDKTCIVATINKAGVSDKAAK